MYQQTFEQFSFQISLKRVRVRQVNYLNYYFFLTDLMRHGDNMALSVSSDCHRRLHRWQVLPNPEVH